jgi:hypothetical protein
MHPEQPICSAGETCYVDRVVTLTSTWSHRGGACRLTAPGRSVRMTISRKPLRIGTDE